MTLADKALEIAITQIGKEEIPRGSNWGPDVEKYLKSVGIASPSPWCMAFVHWSFGQAASALGVKNPLFYTGRVLLQWEMRHTNFGKSSPMPGDIFIMDFGKGLGHTGLVRGVDHATIHTVEGNSNDEGAREGYEVCERIRPQLKIKGYLRFQ